MSTGTQRSGRSALDGGNASGMQSSQRCLSTGASHLSGAPRIAPRRQTGRLVTAEFFGHRRLSRTPPHVQHAHDFGIVIDREEDTVGVRLPPVGQYSDRVIGVEALGRDRTPLRMLVERLDDPRPSIEATAEFWRELKAKARRGTGPGGPAQP